MPSFFFKKNCSCENRKSCHIFIDLSSCRVNEFWRCTLWHQNQQNRMSRSQAIEWNWSENGEKFVVPRCRFENIFFFWTMLTYTYKTDQYYSHLYHVSEHRSQSYINMKQLFLMLYFETHAVEHFPLIVSSFSSSRTLFTILWKCVCVSEYVSVYVLFYVKIVLATGNVDFISAIFPIFLLLSL